jgi:hypothetical protein
VVELLDRLHQPEIAFLDQIQKRHAPPHVLLGDADHQPRIGFDQVLAGGQAGIDL